ncbi:MAG: ATPase domain protein, partial [Anaerocolumna sp.]|nr:ATPase domain protein [Anaerocolumna sp.]
MNDRYTESAKAAITYATEVAYKLSHNYVGTEHLLIGLLEADGVASKVLEKNGVDEEKVVDLVNQLIAPNSSTEVVEVDGFTPRSKRILDQSYQ